MEGAGAWGMSIAHTVLKPCTGTPLIPSPTHEHLEDGNTAEEDYPCCSNFFQEMLQVKETMVKNLKYENSNCLLFAIIGHTMQEEHLVDRYKRKTFTLEELVKGVSGVPTLVGKPKVILIEEYGGGKSS